MERLTCNELKTIRDGFFIHKGNRKDGAKYRMLAESSPKYEEIYRKLADYEDAEKKGLLLRLPCKVGDKAYYVHKGGIDEVEVDSFVLNINLFVNVSYYIGCDRFGKTLTPYKTLFFTKEEAEQALANMKDERNWG